MSLIRTATARLTAQVLQWLRPDLARRVAAGDASAASGRTGRMILRAQARRAVRAGDWSTLAACHKAYWTSAEGDRFYDTYAARGARWFREAHRPWAVAVCDLVATGRYHHVVEIGCGDGRVLAHFAERLPALTRLTGLDLNPSIIARNRDTYAHDARMAFETAEASHWLSTHAEPGLIVAAYGGVLEYFQPITLTEMFRRLAEVPPAAIALVEPLAADFDALHGLSRPHGIECSFSHPYQRLLNQAGYAIRYEQEARLEDRWIMLIAERQADQT